MMPAWVIVETKPSAEEVAERSLRQAGYRVYLPRYRKVLSPHGRARQPVTTMRPLFARVLFVQDWRGWPAMGMSCMVGLMLLRPQVPAKLSDEDVALIIERERAGEFDESAPSGSGAAVRTDLDLGEEVELEAFGSRIMGVLDELTDDGRAIISALMFGRIMSIRVSAAGLKRQRELMGVAGYGKFAK
jgi:hypothetical protein